MLKIYHYDISGMSDEEFEKTYNTTPANVITTYGENRFREMEEEILATLEYAEQNKNNNFNGYQCYLF